MLDNITIFTDHLISCFLLFCEIVPTFTQIYSPFYPKDSFSLPNIFHTLFRRSYTFLSKIFSLTISSQKNILINFIINSNYHWIKLVYYVTQDLCNSIIPKHFAFWKSNNIKLILSTVLKAESQELLARIAGEITANTNNLGTW